MAFRIPICRHVSLIYIIVLVVVFAVEAVVMLLLPYITPKVNGVTGILLDSFIFAVLISGPLYLIALRPLIESEQRLRIIQNTVPECIKLLNRDGTLIDMNPAGLAMIEAESLEQVRGKSVYPLLLPEYRQKFEEHVARVFSGEAAGAEYEIIGLKGRRLWLQTRSVPFRGKGGEVIALLGVTRDITEQKKLESQLIHAQKMEAVGTLTGGIAHDFNNILTAMVGYANILKLRLPQDDPLRPHVDQILVSIERATSLTQRLLAFSRKTAIAPRPVRVNDILTRMEKLLGRLIGEQIEMQTTITPEDTTVVADLDNMEQVILNLATNARDAMPKGGRLSMSTEIVELGPDFIRTYGYGKPGRYVRITVSDTGTGMDEETKNRIFEPFFTTKEVGKGTGLGLSIVYGIVKQHNGYINCESSPGKGATFKIYLPLSSRPANDLDAKRPDDLLGGTETILLAEDDEEVRKITATVLENFGYTVIHAADGEEAVQKFKENKEAVGLLLLDVVMPKKGGVETFDEIRNTAPGIKALFISGYTDSVTKHKGVLEQNRNLILKPISPGVLLKKVREVLDHE